MEKMTFKKNSYIVVKKAVSKELTNFLYNYFKIKKQVYDTCLKHRYFSPFEKIMGAYENEKGQVPFTYFNYGDVASDTLLLKIKPLVEKITKSKLLETYTYARNYKKGDKLNKHKDRASCEISTTLNLGGNSWPIYLQTLSNKNKKIVLLPGDMLIYKGGDLEHWREPFQGKECIQVFLHYNDLKQKNSFKNIFDKRPHVGLPAWFKERV